METGKWLRGIWIYARRGSRACSLDASCGTSLFPPGSSRHLTFYSMSHASFMGMMTERT